MSTAVPAERLLLVWLLDPPKKFGSGYQMLLRTSMHAKQPAISIQNAAVSGSTTKSVGFERTHAVVWKRVAGKAKEIATKKANKVYYYQRCLIFFVFSNV